MQCRDADTHDASCSNKACIAELAASRTIMVVAKLAQRAQREMTGYMCGYTFKRQPVGTKYLQGVAASLKNLCAVAQDGPRSAPKRPKMTQDGPKMAQDRPR